VPASFAVEQDSNIDGSKTVVSVAYNLTGSSILQTPLGDCTASTRQPEALRSSKQEAEAANGIKAKASTKRINHYTLRL
jgi:hypothetical protein